MASISASDRNPGPSAWVRRWAALIPVDGAVLDLACGSGRHARFFAQLGHHVLAADRDRRALAQLADVEGITMLEADLESEAWPLAERRFAAVVVTNYLHRPLFTPMLQAVVPGGVWIYETFAQGNERYGPPRNPEFLLRSGELLDVARGRLRVVAYEEVFSETPRPAVVQRICAVRAGKFEAPARGERQSSK